MQSASLQSDKEKEFFFITITRKHLSCPIVVSSDKHIGVKGEKLPHC